MCTCHNDGDCSDEYTTAMSEFDTSTSRGTSWRTPVEQSVQSYGGEFCRPNCLSPATPKSQWIPSSTPMAPLRLLKRRPDLAHGVAIARRRLDFDRMEMTTSDFDDTPDDTFDLSDVPYVGTGTRRMPGSPPLASSSYYPEHGEEKQFPGTYKLRRVRSPQFSRGSSKQYTPRMTQMTPCGKCLRM